MFCEVVLQVQTAQDTLRYLEKTFFYSKKKKEKKKGVFFLQDYMSWHKKFANIIQVNPATDLK